MFSRRFYTGWIFSSGIMYSAFYLFHGVITNDLLKLTVPKTLFLAVAVVIYLLIGLGISLLYTSDTAKKIIKKPYMRAASLGAITGLFLYTTSFIIGISFSYQATLVNIFIDSIWQIMEETLGAISIALANTLFVRHEYEEHNNYL